MPSCSFPGCKIRARYALDGKEEVHFGLEWAKPLHCASIRKNVNQRLFTFTLTDTDNIFYLSLDRSCYCYITPLPSSFPWARQNLASSSPSGLLPASFREAIEGPGVNIFVFQLASVSIRHIFGLHNGARLDPTYIHRKSPTNDGDKCQHKQYLFRD